MGRVWHALLLVSLVAMVGCLTEEDQQVIDELFDPGSPEELPPLDDVEANCTVQRHMQSEGEASKNVDLLFVIDTSGSLDQERTEIAEGIDSFIDTLEDDVDIQIAVMLAHGSTSVHSGQLFQKNDEPVVLKSSEHTRQEIRDWLRIKMDKHVPGDNDSDGGEAGLYSLNKALDDIEPLKDEGFFRSNAALTTVFVADENDICAVFPEGVVPVPDPNGKEIPAFDRDCGDVTAASVLNKLREVVGQNPLLTGGILYTDPATVPSGGENEVGYGYLELIDLDLGIAIDLATGEYDAALAEIGELVVIETEILKEFQITSKSVEPSSVEVKVDGQSVSFDYIDATRTVHLQEGGGPGSTVDIYYCPADQANF